MSEPDLTREAWLQRAVVAVTPWLEAVEGVIVPEVRVSVGWPSRGGLGTAKRVVGQCWSTHSATDGINQIFISPVRGAEDSIAIVTTLIHELIHAIDDCSSGHHGEFIRIARGVGLVPKWTQSNAGDDLTEQIVSLLAEIGLIPTGAIHGGAAADAPPKQKTRMLKLSCTLCEYTVRTTQKWIDVGLPTCPCGGEMEVAE